MNRITRFRLKQGLAMTVLVASAIVKGTVTIQEGIKIPLQGVILALFFALLYLIVSTKIELAIQGKWWYLDGLRQDYSSPPIKKLCIVAIGVCEELAFRGYFLEFFLEITGSYAVAIAGSAILFALWHHAYDYIGLRKEDLPSLLLLGVITGVLVAIFPGNLWLPIITHVAVSGTIVYATPVLVRLANIIEGKATT